MSWPRQLLFDAALCSSDIDRVNALAATLPMSTTDQTIQDRELRYAEARWIEPGSDSQFIFDILSDLFRSANRQFRYDIDAMREPVLHASYPVGSHFTWHTDTSRDMMTTRKLSVSILLSKTEEFDGGELEFCPGSGFETNAGQGSAVIFPSYMAHRVTPVTRGTRKALVAWIHGEEFR